MYIILIIGFLLIIWILWRLYSRYYMLPCPFWLSSLVELDNPFARAHKAKLIIEFLELSEKMKVLDIGCGPGRVMLPLAQK